MWADLLPPALTAGGLLAIVFMMVMTDRLIPYRTHMRMLDLKQAEIDRLSAALTRAENGRDRLMGLAGNVTEGIVQAIPAAKDAVS